MARRNKTIYLNKKRRGRHRDQKAVWISIVGIGAILGLIIAFWPNAYQVTIDGVQVGILEKKEYVDNAKQTVIAQLESTYKTGVQLEGEENIVIKKRRARQKDMITPNYLVTYMRENMDFLLEFRELSVDGKKIGIIESEAVLDELLEILTKQYIGSTDQQTAFVNEITLEPVFAKEKDLIDIKTLTEKATKTTQETVEYEVVSGDTLWGIASKLGVSINKILAANEGMTEKTTLSIGNKIKAEVDVPLIDVKVVGPAVSEQPTQNE